MLVPYNAFIKNILKKGTTVSLLKYKNKLMDQAINLKNIFQSKTKKEPAQSNTINTKKKKEPNHQDDSTKPEEFSDWKALWR